jgi:predicted N-acetyltransferase YhbS
VTDGVLLRRYRQDDALSVSQLFREIYGDHYVQPHVYLPSMLSQNHCDGRWHSLVAEVGGQIRGHATLQRSTPSRRPDSHTVELALSVVHPDTRGQHIATRLGQQLLIHAQALDYRGVTIKQVTQHPYTQRMADALGFVSTGLLPDYVASPFGEGPRESIVIGFRSIDGHQRPIPALTWPQSCRELMQHLSAALGTRAGEAPWKGPKMRVEHCSGRYEIVLRVLDDDLFAQFRQLPQAWLISLKLRLAEGFAQAVEKLSSLGFSFTGIAPEDRGDGWLALFHRGQQPRKLQLHCPHMQRLHDRTPPLRG